MSEHDERDRLQELDDEVLRLIETGDCDSFDEERFNRLSLRMFEYQYAACRPYQLFCKSKDVRPGSILHWSKIPAVPTQAFKEAVISTIDPAQAVYVYKTSGTSSAGIKPGVVYRDEPAEALCRAAQRRAYKEYMLPDRESIIFFSLAPTPELMPHAGIGLCMRQLAQHFGVSGGHDFFTPTGLDLEGLADALANAEQRGECVAIHGATFSFVRVFDWCQERGLSFRLPPGSRINHGSGFKGRSRELTREEFVFMTEEILGIPEEFNINVLGMTELGSQFYDNTLRNRARSRAGTRAKALLPWARTRVVDPFTLKDLPCGQVGILLHYDLSLRGNVLAIQTDDLGVALEGGFEILGRPAEAEARGCSLTIEEWIDQRAKRA
jgi:hypothetical protein